MKISKLLFLIATLIWATSCSSTDGNDKFLEPARPQGQTHVLGLTCDPIPTVRVGFIGLGMRGTPAVRRFTFMQDVEIKAICDLEQMNLDRTQRVLKNRNFPKAEEYIGDEAWKKLCERDDIDLIYICTDWLNHTPMAVYAMQMGKHVAIEVPAATSIDQCWDLVNTAEQTRKHCVMLENCCYDFFEMATLNMAQQGLFGTVVHGEGAYIHDLRELSFNNRVSDSGSFVPGSKNENQKLPGLKGYWNSWRKEFNRTHTGNAYPTHGFGPICQIMNIHRGDKMNTLVSLSSDQFGMTEYAKNRFGEDSKEAKEGYEMGDMNTTLIKTEKGKTIMIQHDVTSPRPYSRIHLVSGTKGFAQKWPLQHIALEPNSHKAVTQEIMDSLLLKYEHPIITKTGEKAREVGGHGGMDFIMDYRIVYCLQNGLPMDMDVYDAAEWSSLVELSEYSALNGGQAVRIPDFTRGDWNVLKKLEFAE